MAGTVTLATCSGHMHTHLQHRNKGVRSFILRWHNTANTATTKHATGHGPEPGALISEHPHNLLHECKPASPHYLHRLIEQSDTNTDTGAVTMHTAERLVTLHVWLTAN
jgi:hypothetical protein